MENKRFQSEFVIITQDEGVGIKRINSKVLKN